MIFFSLIIISSVFEQEEIQRWVKIMDRHFEVFNVNPKFSPQDMRLLSHSVDYGIKYSTRQNQLMSSVNIRSGLHY